MFISSFSELLGINVEGLKSLLLGVDPTFIQIYFDRVWLKALDLSSKILYSYNFQRFKFESPIVIPMFKID